MNTVQFNQTCSKTVNTALKTIRVEAWGFIVPADSELDALRIAYVYRNAPNGCKIDTNEATGYWGVTVWNKSAKSMGCDC